MNTQRRFRPRFTIRTLAIFVTLVCAYFGAWDATKKYGVPNPPTEISYPEAGYFRYIESASSPMPFIIQVEEREVVEGGRGGSTIVSSVYRTAFYLWLSGPTIALPYERRHW